MFPIALCAGPFMCDILVLLLNHGISRFEEMCIAFNGGKDCTVMLDLLHAMLVR